MKKSIFLTCIFLISFQQNDKLPNSSFERGKQYYLKGNFKLAIIEFGKAIETDSSIAESYFFRSSAYFHMEYYRNALSDMEKYIVLKPLDAKGFVEISQLRSWINSPFGSRDSTKPFFLPEPDKQILMLSIKDINQAIKLDSSMALSYSLKAEYLTELCENHLTSFCDSIYKEVIDLYSKTLRMDSSNYAAYYNRAHIKIMTGDTIGACIDFQKRMNKDSNCKNTLEWLCKISKNENIKKRICTRKP